MADEPLLCAEDLHKRFGRRSVLAGADFSAHPGALIGIVGENGSGKSTLLRVLAGDLRPDHGGVTLRGTMGYCPQKAILNDSLTVRQHLDYFRAAYNIEDLDRADELIGRLGYRAYYGDRAGSLSEGSRQKLNLTLALMHRPGVLLLDEPYQGLDWETYGHFWEIVAELRTDGCSVVVVSHLVYERQRFDRMFCLKEGRLAGC